MGLKLHHLDYRQNAGTIGDLALSAAGVESKIRSTLAHPTQALGDAINHQLNLKGYRLTGLGLRFNPNNTLFVGLNGVPLTPKS